MKIMAHLSLAALLFFIFSNTLSAGELRGEVVSQATGKPLVGALVNIETGNTGATYISVFSDENGQFVIPDASKYLVNPIRLTVKKLAYRSKNILLSTEKLGGDEKISVALQQSSNISADVPPSAWLAKMDNNVDKSVLVLNCSGCHQFPSDKVRNYANKITAHIGSPENTKKALSKEWAELVKKESWRATLKYMRTKVFSVFPEGSSVELSKFPWEMVQSDALSLWNGPDNDLIIKTMVDEFPRSTAEMSASGYSYDAEFGTNSNTVIREYSIQGGGLVREATWVKGSQFIWGADVRKNRILRMDPTTGQQKWFDVPFDGATGPHTIIGGDDGAVWVSMIENDQFGRFDPETETWKLWTLTPDNLKGQGVVGGQAAVHDIAVDSSGLIRPDANGDVWVTLIGLNKMAALTTATGAVKVFDAPAVPGHTAVSTGLYGAVMNAGGHCVWFTQLNSNVGCMDVNNGKVSDYLSFPKGAGPRRMTLDARGEVWIPLYGAGQLARYTPGSNGKYKIYDLPDRAAAPYAAHWDKKRDVVWLTTSNADVIYRFDIKSEKFYVYPLPRKGGYLRQLSLNHQTGELVGSYGNIPEGSGPAMIVVINPGN